MTCALCRALKPLKRSHIIPEFMYESLYDPQLHRFRIIDKESETRIRFAQKGLRQELLCEPCEQKLGVYERYISLLFRGDINVKHQRTGDLVTLTGVQYPSMRLFQLAIFWRASISKLKFFEQVSLGPHEELIRQLLLDGNTGEPWQYPCLMFALLNEGQLQKDLIVQPTWTRLDNLFGYRFVFSGFVWVFIVASHCHPRHAGIASLTRSGELRFLITELASGAAKIHSEGEWQREDL